MFVPHRGDCDQLPETTNHIIIGYVYSREVWTILLSKLHLHEVVLEEKVLEWWLRSSS